VYVHHLSFIIGRELTCNQLLSEDEKAILAAERANGQDKDNCAVM
jgi:hypothetical protein